MTVGGRAWVFGDRIDTDVLAPGSLMKLDAKTLVTHCLKAVRPEFSSQARPGDLIFAGQAFGVGSSREQAAICLKVLGISAVLALSFARIFYRNAYNQGVPAIIFPATRAIRDGDRVSLDLALGELVNHSTAEVHRFPAIPEHLTAIVAAGGLTPYLKMRLAQTDTAS